MRRHRVRFEELPTSQGPRFLPDQIERNVRTGTSRAFVVERVIRTVWSETRNSEPVGGTVRKLREWVRASDNPVMWESRVRWGLLSVLVDPKLSPLDRFHFASIVRKWG